jgi:transposase
MPSSYDPRRRGPRLSVWWLTHRDDYSSEWAAITAVSKRLGMNAETLRNWIRQREVDAGQRDGVSSESARRRLRARLRLFRVSAVTTRAR